MAVTSNEGSISHLVNGRPLKSINQYYNKTYAEIVSKLAERDMNTSKKLRRLTRKRNNKTKDYMHKASRSVVDLMVENKIGNCFIGHNDGWKQEVNIGKRNNQNFVSIPHSQLIGCCLTKQVKPVSMWKLTMSLTPPNAHSLTTRIFVTMMNIWVRERNVGCL